MRQTLRRHTPPATEASSAALLLPQRGFAPAVETAPAAPSTSRSPIQPYFMLNKQRTNDEGVYLGESETSEKLREKVWNWGLKEKVKKLTKLDETYLLGFKEKLLDLAVDETKYSLSATCRQIKAIHTLQEEAKTSVSERDSPTGMSGISSVTLSKPEKPKHSPALYRRANGEETTIDLDDMTKDPARRARTKAPLEAPTELQAWTRSEIKTAFNAWTGTVPLVQHLASVLFKHLANTEEGRKWEVKIREFARVLNVRTTEVKNLTLSIRSKEDEEDIRSFTRSDYEPAAREKVRKKILKGTEPPPSQSDVLYFDDLLRSELPSEWLVGSAGEALALNTQKAESPGSLSMTLTHWRTILYFDWYLGHDVLRHSAD